jgi:hypothetical protein
MPKQHQSGLDGGQESLVPETHDTTVVQIFIKLCSLDPLICLPRSHQLHYLVEFCLFQSLKQFERDFWAE